MTGSPERVDVCVAGGGIIGLAVAFELARRGRRVTVLERDRVGERAAAGVAAGMLAPISEADISDPRLTKLALASHAAYPEWVAEIERASGERVGFDRTGTLIVALHRDHLAELAHLEAFQRDRGLEAVRVGAQEARQLEPLLAPSVVGGLHIEHDDQVDPRRLMRALVAALRELGGTLVERAAVRRVVRSGDGFVVHYERPADAPDEPARTETLEADRVVIAGGVWSGEIDAPIPPLPLRPIKGQILRLRGEPLIRHVVRTPDVYMVPRADGELVVGATMEEMGFDGRVMAGAVYELLKEAWRVLPGIYELELAEASVGFRPALRDYLPALGATETEGLYVATGHLRNGVELAPISARLLADQMCEGRFDPLLFGLSPRRFEVEAVRP